MPGRMSSMSKARLIARGVIFFRLVDIAGKKMNKLSIAKCFLRSEDFRLNFRHFIVWYSNI